VRRSGTVRKVKWLRRARDSEEVRNCQKGKGAEEGMGQ